MACKTSGAEGDDERNVIEIFGKQVTYGPHNIAAICGKESLTYRQLDTRSSNLAAKLLRNGVAVGDRVVVLTARNLDMLVFFLAVLKAGACYVPIDLESQSGDRIRSVVERVRPRVVLSSDPSQVYGFHNISWTNFRGSHYKDQAVEGVSVSVHVNLSDLAYIIFTSGTSSEPKGVMIPHRALSNYVQQYSEEAPFNMGVRSGDVVLSIFSPAFDACTGVVFCTLCHGGTLLMSSPRNLEDSLARSTILPATPSLLRSLRSPPKDSQLRAIFLGGESPTSDLINLWRTHDRKMYNAYGPTETTCASLMIELLPDRPVTLGYSMPNSTVVLLDAEGREADEGEICISGPGLARGYFENEELTMQKFIFLNRRFYRTGDFARRQDQHLYFLGRQDALIKNRGYLVNLEAQVMPALRAQHGLQQAFALQYEGQLVAFVTPDIVDTSDLRRRMMTQYDGHTVPDKIIALADLPVTSNGKVDARALRTLIAAKYFENIEANRMKRAQPSQDKLQILKEVVSLNICSSDSELGRRSFIQLGGNSHSAIRVVAELRERGLSLAMGRLIGSETLEELAMSITEAKTIKPENEGHLEDMSLTTKIQERLMIGSSKYHALNYMVVEMELPHEGQSSIDGELRQTWGQLIQRHSILSQCWSTTSEKQFKSPLLMPLDWETVVADDLREVGKVEDVIRTQLLELTKNFDASGLHTAFRLIVVPEKQSKLLWLVHHAQVDGWSVRVLVQELQALLDGKALPSAPQFFQAGSLQKMLLQSIGDEHQQFWTSITKASLKAKFLPLSRYPQPGRWEETKVEQTYLGLSLEQLELRCRNLGITASTALYAAWAVVLMKYTNASSANFGVVFSGRNLAMTRADRVVGPLINVRPFPVSSPESNDKLEWLQSIHRQNLRMSDAQWGYSDDGPSTFDTLVVLQFGLPEVALSCTAIPGVQSFSTSQMSEFTWTLLMEEDKGELKMRMLYDARVVTSKMTVRALGHLKNVLHKLLEAADNKFSSVKSQMQSLAEQHSLIHHASQLHDGYEGSSSIKEAFEVIVAQYPDATAVASPSGSLRYRDIDHIAAQIASIFPVTAYPGDVVAVVSDGSLEWLCATLAVVKAGAAYCPIDVKLPKSYIKLMLQLCEAKFILIPSAKYVALIESLRPEPEAAPFQQPSTKLESLPGPQDHVYQIFTSGTSGLPKSIKGQNLPLLSYLQYSPARLHAQPGRKIAQNFSVGFDACVAEIWGTLCYGATLMLKDPNDFLANILDADAVNITPSMLISLRPQDLPNIKTMMVGGEAVPRSLVDKWSPGRQLFIAYGPAECTVACLFSETTSGKPVSLGRPVPRTSVYILDKEQQPVPIGLPGEIYVTGMQTLEGYVHGDHIKSNAFLADPFNAGLMMFRTGDIGRWNEYMEVEYLGREDRQVKVRGYRVSLEEVEAVISKSSSTVEQVAVALSNSSILGFVAPVGVDLDEIAIYLQDNLPSYARPARLIPLEDLPQTVNHKTDYRALAKVQTSLSCDGQTPPSDPIAALIAEIWREIVSSRTSLDSKISLESDFIDLGGDSILQMQVSRRLSQELGCNIPFRTVLTHSKLAPLAEAVASVVQETVATTKGTFMGMLHNNSIDTNAVSSTEQELVHLSHSDPESASFNMPLLLTLHGPLDYGRLVNAVNRMISNCRVLRSRYLLAGDRVRRAFEESSLLLDIRRMSCLDMDFVEKEINRPFNLSKDDMLRLTVMETNSDHRHILLVAHHSVMDGSSVAVFLKLIQTLYTKGEPPMELRGDGEGLDYIKWVAWKQSIPINIEKLFWKGYLSDAISIFPDRNSTATRLRGRTIHCIISRKIANATSQCCKTYRISRQQLAIACAAITVQEVYQTYDVLLAVPFSDRREPGTDDLIGLFLERLPVRIKLGNGSLRDIGGLFALVKDQSELAAQKFIPLANIRQAVGEGHPVFDLMVSFHPMTEKFNLDLPGCVTTIERLKPKGAKFPLMLELFEEQNGWVLEVEYSDKHVGEKHAEELATVFQEKLAWLCDL
ncbi:MAG: hypothetical protein Q9157_002097 [Trypethelium eluteriae]